MAEERDMPLGSEETRGRSSYAGFRATIKAVGTGRVGSRSLSFEEAREAMRALLAGEATDAQAGAFLIAMRVKGEEPEELAGLVQALRDAAVSRQAEGAAPVACAGAYDGVSESPQLSLAAAALAAACGAPCLVHCGDTLGPKYGTNPADVLAALGGPSRPGLETSRRMLASAGTALLHSGEAIPGWDRLARIRDQIGLRGPVHSAEKLVDHLGARRFVVGYTHQPYGPRIVAALDRLGAESTVAVRGIEGSDVPRPARPQATGTAPLDLPQQLELRMPTAMSSAEDSAGLTRAVLAGEEGGAVRTAVVLGAFVRLCAAGRCDSFAAGAATAEATISSGSATATLERMLEAAV
jgi:anthranilate phosphoribosyltransferase